MKRIILANKRIIKKLSKDKDNRKLKLLLEERRNRKRIELYNRKNNIRL
jgi:hypothetical protein